MTSNFYKEPEFETLQLHAGQDVDPATNARAPPIYASTSFVFNDSAHGADLFGLRAFGNIYSRIGNPTVEVFEKRIAALEGGVAAVAASSGQAAQFMAVGTIAGAGDNIVSTSYLYGGVDNSRWMYAIPELTACVVLFKKYGIAVKFVTSDDPAAFAAAIDEKTKAVFVESIGNPKYNVSPISEIAKVAHEHKVPLIVDNTFGMGVRPSGLVDTAPPSRELSLIRVGTVLAAGKYTWWISRSPSSGAQESSTGPPGASLPSPLPLRATTGSSSQRRSGTSRSRTKLRIEILRDLGATLNPFAAFLLLQGLETLSLRAQRHCDNALELARYLEKHEKVAWVSYTGLTTHPSYQLALKTLRPNTFGSVLSFGVKGGKDAAVGAKVVDSLKLASNLANVGDAKTLVIHPATTTHQQLTADEQFATGVTSDLIRVSVGIENIQDIIADFEGALRTV
ncbi:O-acetylhomoserine ami [Lactarius sanguifluus]|nr:O-acetylhomoserine ami [Lactarius sanguifluus]